MARITRMTKRRLGELLQAEGLLTEDQLRNALDEQRKSNLFLGEALVKLGFVSEEVIAQTIVQQFSLPFMAAQSYTITTDVLNTFPERMYFEYQFIAVDKIGRTLLIVGAGLMNHDVLDELERLSGCKVCQYVSTWKDIRATLDKYAKDLKKDQQSLSDLGSLLLDPAAAAAKPAQPAPAAPASAPATTTSAVTKTGPRPAAPTAFGTGLIAAAASTTPAAAAGRSPPPRAHGPGTSALSVKPPSAGGALAPISASGSNAGLKPPAGTTIQRLSALSGGRAPGKTSAPGVTAVKETPSPPPSPPPDDKAPAAPPQIPGKTGLLGLFKKP